MKVKDLMRLLSECDPEAKTIFNAPFQGFEPVTAVVRRPKHGGVGGRSSYEEIPTVEFTNGDVEHMRSQGMDVLGSP